MAKRTKYQEKIIRNYYENKDAISLQRLQELVTELYLSEGKKRERNWELLVTHLQKLGVAQQRIDHLVTTKDATLVAELVQQLVSKK